MATERQIAANRRNATKSTGPKTSIGKQRSSKNAYRHGFCVPINDVDTCDDVERLVRDIVGDSKDTDIRRCATNVARPHIDLVRISHLKVSVMNRVIDCGLEPHPFLFDTATALNRYHGVKPPFELSMPDWSIVELWECGKEDVEINDIVPWLLSKLRSLDRYEARAFADKMSALHELSRRMFEQKIKL